MSHVAENRSRQPKGRPTGGQFAEEAKSASGIALTGPAADQSAYQALLDKIDRGNGGLATQLSATLSAEEQANHLSIRSHLAAVRPVLAEAGITQVRLDGWWGDPDGSGCYIDEIATTDSDGFIFVEDYEASAEAKAALTHLVDGIAPIDGYAAALGQEPGKPVYLHTTEDPEGLFNEAKLRAEGNELLGKVNRATHVKTFAEPGQRPRWAADQALNALRHGTDLTDPEDDHEVQTAIADALANLRHLATRRGLNFEDAIRVSARYETDDVAEDAMHSDQVAGQGRTTAHTGQGQPNGDPGEHARWVQAGQEDPDFGVYLKRNLGPAGIAQYVREGVDLAHVRAAYANGVELEPGGFVHPNSAA